MTISKNSPGRITITFPYNPNFVIKVNSVPRHEWHPDKKCWSFPNTDGTLTPHSPINLRGDEGGLAFKGEDIHLGPALKAKLPIDVIARSEATKQSHKMSPSLAKRASS